MMRKLSLIAAAMAALASIAAAPAAGQFCYDVDVVVNGDAVVDEEGCEETPELP